MKPRRRPREAVADERANEVEVLVDAEEAEVDAAPADGLREHLLRRGGGRDLAGDTDHPCRVGHREAHDLQERGGVEHGVRIDAADVPVARDVQRRVPGVRLAAVLLVHHEEVRVGSRCGRSPRTGCDLEDVAHEHLVRREVERLAQRSSVSSVDPSFTTITSNSG